MPQTTFLATTEVWAAIESLVAAKRRGPCSIASAYLGPGSAARLALQKGDRLLTALSIPAAKLGQVSPTDLLAYRKTGVALFREEALHAKIYLGAKEAIVGSANISASSMGRLDEAALRTTDPAVLRAVRAWFDARMGQEVEPAFLETCAEAWRPPIGAPGTRGPESRKARDNPRRSAAMREQVALLRTMEGPPTDNEAMQRLDARVEAAIRAGGRQVPRAGRDSLEWNASGGVVAQLRPGDVVIFLGPETVTRPDGRTAVIETVGPPLTVLAVVAGRRKSGKGFQRIEYAMPVDTPSLPWARFRQALRHEGVVVEERFRSRVIADPAAAAVIRRMASPSSLRRLAKA